MSFATPADVLARRSQLILNGDADGFAALFAPDAVIESSFAGPPGTPARLDGREAIREYAKSQGQATPAAEVSRAAHCSASGTGSSAFPGRLHHRTRQHRFPRADCILT